MHTIRASSLPLALACPASQVPPQTRLADDSAESRLGSACHQALAVLVRDGADPFQQAIEDAAASWRCDLEEVSALAWRGKQCWDKLQNHFPSAYVEQPLSGIAGDDELGISGHPDVLSFVDDEIRLLDWKIGREDSDFEDQVRAYAWLAMHWRETEGRTLAIVCRVREMTVDTYYWTGRELGRMDAWRRPRHGGRGAVPRGAALFKFAAGAASAMRNYVATPSGHEIVRQPPRGPRTEQWRPTRCSPPTTGSGLVEDACEDGREALRGEVAMCGGSVTASDGRTLALVRQERQEINSGLAWPVLENRFGLHAVAEAAKLTKTAVTKLAMDAAPPRGKGKAAKQIIEDLDAAGAITVTTIEKLEVKRNGNANSREVASHEPPALGATGGADAIGVDGA
jgi:hypothetical protein